MSRGTWERKMGKRTKGNYIKGYFLRLFLLVAVLVSVMGIALLQFSKRVVGDEIIKLHQTILRSTAGETASVLGGLRESILEIAQNVQLTEWLESGVGDESEIDRLTEDEIYLNFKRGNPLRVYIYDQEKLRYSSDRREVPWEEVRGQLSPSGEEEDFWMAGPVRVQEEGLYRNSFFMIQRVRNLLEYFGQEIPENMQGHSLCGTILRDDAIREYALFGQHGVHVNITDGRYVYMRCPQPGKEGELYNYVLEPSSYPGAIREKEMRTVEAFRGFNFTKGMPVWKMKGGYGISSLGFPPKTLLEFGTLLYDLEEDPAQEHPIQDAEVEERMKKHMALLMKENDAPMEQYTRLGLEYPG